MRWRAIRSHAAIAGLAIGALAPVASATLPGRNGLLAFSSRPTACPASGAANLFTVRADGSRRRKVTTYRCSRELAALGPAWSPRGTRLLHLRVGDASNSQIQVVVTRPDGSRPRVAAEGNALAWGPLERLAWGRVGGERPGIYVGPFEDPYERFIADGYAAAWSPDGRSLAVAQETGFLTFCSRLAIYEATTGDLERVLVAPKQRDGRCVNSAVAPDWSPDGRWIAFGGSGSADGASSTNYEIYVIDRTGNRRGRLTRGPARPGNPVWSPDGRLIAYLRSTDESQDVYVMRRDGSRRRRIARNAMTLAWQSRP